MPILLPPGAGPTAGLLKYEWLDPQGILRDLSYKTSPDLFVARGSIGLGVPPVEIVRDKLPWSAGDIERRVQTKAVEIELPIYARGSGMAGLIDKVDDLCTWFDTGDERAFRPGYLRITRPNDDAVRQVRCLYQGGLEGDLSQGSPGEAIIPLSLLAPDPYWTDVAETTASYVAADLGSSLGVVNTGDVDAYPIWEIAGPASNIVLTNTTTGKVLALNANGGVGLSTGDTLTIDTRPPSQRTTLPITDQNGASYYSRVGAGGSLWWLTKGANTFTIAASGTSGATSIGLRWLPRYRGVLR